ncbi:hypothetical protein EDD18DRAFT_1102686 [Armillaria luteobubalina]|uniref:Uncharacterized protein n=1 Tax=Armillaria luteobubalina TaxID=153913 RepID=A0AA39QBL8_9AGAR|nr:hypothetical protein EDD18DRAFT_1102686 [Armillaria luteobubalina]
MDRFYNKENARASIDGLISNRMYKDPYHLGSLVKDQKAISNMYIKKDEDTGAWRIVRSGRTEGALEEIVFTITDAINMLDLPPLTRETRGFKDAVKAIRMIQQMGEHEFKEGELEDWKPMLMQGFTVIELSNRYFRPCTLSNEEESVPFSTDVDPEGVLSRLMHCKLMHMDNNIICYFKAKIDEKGKKKYTIAKPQIFHVGDIVEAQCSVVFLKGNSGAVQLKLASGAGKTLILEVQQASSDRKSVTDQPGKVVVRMKRKIGFRDNTEDDKYEGLKRMNEGGDNKD